MGISATERVETTHIVEILTPFGSQTFIENNEFTHRLVLIPESLVQHFTIAEELLLRVVLSGDVYREDLVQNALGYGRLTYGTSEYGVGIEIIISTTFIASAKTHRVTI